MLIDRRIRGGDKIVENGKGTGQREEHILVLSHSQAFVLFTRWEGRPIDAPKMAQKLEKIRQMSKNRSPMGVVPLGAASTGKRERAAKFWGEMVKGKLETKFEFKNKSECVQNK